MRNWVGAVGSVSVRSAGRRCGKCGPEPSCEEVADEWCERRARIAPPGNRRGSARNYIKLVEITLHDHGAPAINAPRWSASHPRVRSPAGDAQRSQPGVGLPPVPPARPSSSLSMPPHAHHGPSEWLPSLQPETPFCMNLRHPYLSKFRLAAGRFRRRTALYGHRPGRAGPRPPPSGRLPSPAATRTWTRSRQLAGRSRRCRTPSTPWQTSPAPLLPVH